MAFETEQHGRYEIKSGPLGGTWAANAFRRKLLVAKAVGASREDAIAAVKANLDRLGRAESDGRDEEGAPSASVYEAAFALLIPDMPDSYMAMLRAHLAATDHLISATRLAQAAGYTGYEGANLHYGKLGQRIADEIDFDPPRREDGTKIWTCAIARDPSLDTDYPDTVMLDALAGNFDDLHFEWQMRPQVVTALRALGL
ncbi:hypothetical protein C8J46_103448 [Sphingomonas sp. PP-F2F-A104-K0414]|uniref:hypothetical protein n=1 Tax=Sphingomonas sp. PP-F2F-A104-K0414 TaxID=2135661 RepID=UPI0010506315|nr:hypothetical protein [Sphingomonas sp. PP-F2F-A104-K0414]TCP99560.1 hypothetical protein C8J46_103448 [Sphingomonas sp. PP-F2F-A104-K0414]